MDDSNREDQQEDDELGEGEEIHDEGEHEDEPDEHMEATNHQDQPGVETLSQVLWDKEWSLKMVKERRKQVEWDA